MGITLEEHAKDGAYYHNRINVVTVRSDSQNLSENLKSAETYFSFTELCVNKTEF